MPEVTIDGRTLAYTDTGGEGSPVLFLHAFPLDGRMWASQIEALRGRHRCMVPDLTGFGGSDAPDDPGAYSMDGWADLVAGFLDHLAIARTALVGLSMGGYVAFALLRRRPELVSALVLADTRAEADPPEGKEKRSTQQQMVRDGRRDELIQVLAGALVSDATKEGKPDVTDGLPRLMDNPEAGFVGALEAMKNRPDSTETLATIGVPTLVLVGEHDAVTPPEAARKLHEHVGGSRLVVIPEAGHLSNLESPDAFNGALVEFLSEHA